MTTQFINFDLVISQYASNTVSQLASTVIGDLLSANDNSIISTLSINVPTAAINRTIDVDTIAAGSIVTTTDELELFLGGNGIISVPSTLNVSTDTNVGKSIGYLSSSVDSVLAFGTSTFVTTLDIQAITSTASLPSPSFAATIGNAELISTTSTLTFGTSQLDRAFDLNSITATAAVNVVELDTEVELGSITSTAAFSNDAAVLSSVSNVTVESALEFGNIRTNQFLDDESSVVSTAVVSTDLSVRKVINFDSIESTVFVSTTSFSGFTHRSLIFKEDNIAKIGPADSVEVVNGIVLNPSNQNTTTATSGSATLPSNPVGFITVTINDINYRIPYYNE